MFEVDNELLKMLRDGNWREYEVARSICSSQWGIGWVVFGRNELCDDARDRAGAVSQEGVNSLEHAVDGVVAMTPDPPAFDNTGVITVDDDVGVLRKGARDGFEQKLETDCFSPGNVSFAVSGLPVGQETPRPPSLPDDDSNADTSASI